MSANYTWNNWKFSLYNYILTNSNWLVKYCVHSHAQITVLVQLTADILTIDFYYTTSQNILFHCNIVCASLYSFQWHFVNDASSSSITVREKLIWWGWSRALLFFSHISFPFFVSLFGFLSVYLSPIPLHPFVEKSHCFEGCCWCCTMILISDSLHQWSGIRHRFGEDI